MTTDPLTLYKLIVLYMLDKVKFKLTYSQISGFILEKEYTNFLTLQQVISDLQDAELIKTDASMNRTFFSITEEGRNTLSYFGNRIGDAIIGDIDTFLSEKHLEIFNGGADLKRLLFQPLHMFSDLRLITVPRRLIERLSR